MPMSAVVKGFGCRPLHGSATGLWGRRSKTSKGGNRWVGEASTGRASYGDFAQALGFRGRFDGAGDGATACR